MEDIKDAISEFIMLIAVIALIGYLLVIHTGTNPNQITPLYWAGFATPLFSQILKKMFNLVKALTSKQ